MSEQVAEVLAAHRLHASMNICTGCAWRAVGDGGGLFVQHAAHLAEALERLIAERERVAAERAWREGARTGGSRAMRMMSDEPGLPLASDGDNPYAALSAAQDHDGTGGHRAADGAGDANEGGGK